MGEITPNLDDGELWLPSDILPDEIFSNKFDPNFSTELNKTSLPHLLPTYSLFEQNHISSEVPTMNLDPNSKQIRPQNQFCGMGKTQPEMGLGFYGETPVGHCLDFSGNGGGGDSYFESSPYHQFHDTRELALPIVGDILQARSMMLQRQQIMQQRYFERVQNNFLPLQVNNESWSSGFHRGYRGTGVFIPRTPPTTVANPGKKQSFRKEEGSIHKDKRLGGSVKRPNPPTDDGVFGSVLNY